MQASSTGTAGCIKSGQAGVWVSGLVSDWATMLSKKLVLGALFGDLMSECTTPAEVVMQIRTIIGGNYASD